MRLFGRFFLLLLVVPVAELYLLVRIGQRVGLAPTLALVVATALAGGWLLRREGLGVLGRIQARMAAGALPGHELVDGAIILVAGVLLLTPGVLTDTVGLLGLLPPTRALLRRAVDERLRGALTAGAIRVVPGPFGARPPAGPAGAGVEDAELVEVRDAPRRPPAA